MCCALRVANVHSICINLYMMKNLVKQIKLGILNGSQARELTGLPREASAKWGYTMIEMLVVMSIIVIMSVALFANYREIGDQGRISSFAGKMREDLYLAQNYSLSGRTNKSDIPTGWGVYFNRELNKYIIFSDLNKSATYNYPTKLLIHGTETVASNRFIESSFFANSVTVSGATQAPLPGMPGDNIGYWSFNGSGNYLTVSATDSAFANVGTEDFAIDLWIYPATLGSQMAIFYRGTGGGVQSFTVYKNASDKIIATVYDTIGTAFTASSTGAVASSTWTHVAVVKAKNILRLAIDGAINQSVLMTTAVLSQTAAIAIGINDNLISNSWNGYLDEIRFSRGTGRWSERFTPPTVMYSADDERFREIKLPPGLVFDYLKLAGATTTELNVFFDVSPNSTSTPPTYLMYGNGVSGQEAKVIINNAGVAGTSQAGDTPQTLTIDKSGTINWTH